MVHIGFFSSFSGRARDRTTPYHGFSSVTTRGLLRRSPDALPQVMSAGLGSSYNDVALESTMRV